MSETAPGDRRLRGGREIEKEVGGDRFSVKVYPGCEAVILFDPETTFECVDSCTWCCHHGVLLYESDYMELSTKTDLKNSTTQVRGKDFIKREPKNRMQFVDKEGKACHFLDDDGRCGLQCKHDWKPTRCSVFPLSVEKNGEGLYIDIRESAEINCEGINESNRRLIDHLDAFLPRNLWEIDNPDSLIEL